uniref:Uncharacterized protein n=1 Tax=Anguilla anguilla TaxID=7936 RepID=A0A0E9X853_ANGAN
MQTNTPVKTVHNHFFPYSTQESFSTAPFICPSPRDSFCNHQDHIPDFLKMLQGAARQTSKQQAQYSLYYSYKMWTQNLIPNAWDLLRLPPYSCVHDSSISVQA